MFSFSCIENMSSFIANLLVPHRSSALGPTLGTAPPDLRCPVTRCPVIFCLATGPQDEMLSILT